MAKDKIKNRVTNIASGNAKVGLQVDGDVVITGGLSIGGGRGSGGKGGTGLDAFISAAIARGGAVNIAGGNDTVAFQAGQACGDGEDDL